jgi:hypothetical protein
MIRIHNSQTNEIIDREMTEIEFIELQEQQTAAAQSKAEAEAKAQAKAELLERLGITADEAKLLLA